MESAAQSTQTSSATSAVDRTDVECAQCIRALGWWQGSIITDERLRQVMPDLPTGFDHWVMASQTCNLYNTDFSHVRMVEWIGARKINALGRPRSGIDPRRLHCRATTGSGGDQTAELLLELDIQTRAWMQRALLADLTPHETALRDGREPSQHAKDHFIGWMARSYTRLELSDALNDALKNSKITDIIDKVATKHGDLIWGIFLEIGDYEEEDEETPRTATADIEPPCMVEVTFVVYRGKDEATVRESLNAVRSQEVPNPKYVPGPNVKRDIARALVAEKFHIELTCEVRPMAQWTAAQISQTVRYSLLDHLSGSDVADS
jgi:hypothetical protein